MSKKAILSIATAVLALAGAVFLLLWEGLLFGYQDPDYLPERTVRLPESRLELTAPEGWNFLAIPNQYLSYPEAVMQLASDSREAFCIVVPETIPEGEEFTLQTYQDLIVGKIQEQKEPKILSQEESPSDWSRRARIVYTAQPVRRGIRYLVQLDVAEPFAYRTVCWCVDDRYAAFEKDFLQLCDNLRMLPGEGTAITN